MSSSKFQEHLASLNTAVCDIIYVELLSAATISRLAPTFTFYKHQHSTECWSPDFQGNYNMCGLGLTPTDNELKLLF